MTGNTQELDEIFTKYTKQVIDMCHGNRPDVADESAKAKQAILDWHNKQVEEVLDRIEATKTIYKARAHNDKGVLTTMIVTTAIPLDAIQAERNKLKEKYDT